jgi:hypothetical protein
MTRGILSFSLLAAVTFGQVVPTHIGRHQIGETLQEWSRLEAEHEAPHTGHPEIAPLRLGEPFVQWLAINQLDLNDICQKHSRSIGPDGRK